MGGASVLLAGGISDSDLIIWNFDHVWYARPALENKGKHHGSPLSFKQVFLPMAYMTIVLLRISVYII